MAMQLYSLLNNYSTYSSLLEEVAMCVLVVVVVAAEATVTRAL